VDKRYLILRRTEQHKFLIRCDLEILDNHALYVTQILPNNIGLRNPSSPPPPKKKEEEMIAPLESIRRKKTFILKKMGFKSAGKLFLSLSLEGLYISQLINIFKYESLRCGLDEALSKLNTVLVSIMNTNINLLP
jgi:hypothetical protein